MKWLSLWEPFYDTQDMVGGIPLKRIASLFLALTCAMLLLCGGIQGASASKWMPSNGKPYYIMVNRAQSTVTVYELDEQGYYTVPVKAMVCSTGRKGHATPTGTYTIGGRWTWVHMLDDSYGQYCTQIKGNILFHSVCYTKKDPSTLMTHEYNGLGAPASLGCVRLQTADAKWIYDNCARGTKVTIYDDAESPGPLGKPEKLVPHISEEQANGWDPTDPREANPWHTILAEASEPAPSPSPEPAPSPTPSPAPAEERVSYADVAQSLYRLAGGSKYTHASQFATWAVERRLMDGMIQKDFDPLAPIPRQDMAVMFYQYETVVCRNAPRGHGSLSPYSDWSSIRLNARDAMRWALGNRLIQPLSNGQLSPAGYATRPQLDMAVQRYEQLH